MTDPSDNDSRDDDPSPADTDDSSERDDATAADKKSAAKELGRSPGQVVHQLRRQRRMARTAWLFVGLGGIAAAIVAFTLDQQPPAGSTEFEERLGEVMQAELNPLLDWLAEQPRDDADMQTVRMLLLGEVEADARDPDADPTIAYLKRHPEPALLRAVAWHLLDAIEANVLGEPTASGNGETLADPLAGHFEMQEVLDLWWQAAPNDLELVWVNLLFVAARGDLLDGYAFAVWPLRDPEAEAPPELYAHGAALLDTFRDAVHRAGLTDSTFADRFWALRCAPRYAPGLHALLLEQLDALVWELWWNIGPDEAALIANVPAIVGSAWRAVAVDAGELLRAVEVEAFGHTLRQELKLLAGKRDEAEAAFAARREARELAARCQLYLALVDPFPELHADAETLAAIPDAAAFARAVDERAGALYRARLEHRRGEVGHMLDWLAGDGVQAAAAISIPDASLANAYQILGADILYPTLARDDDRQGDDPNARRRAVALAASAWLSLLDRRFHGLFPELTNAQFPPAFHLTRQAACALLRLGPALEAALELAPIANRHPNIGALLRIGLGRDVTAGLERRLTLDDQPGLWSALLLAGGARLAERVDAVLDMWENMGEDTPWPPAGRDITIVAQLRRVTGGVRVPARPESWRLALRSWAPPEIPLADRAPQTHPAAAND